MYQINQDRLAQQVFHSNTYPNMNPTIQQQNAYQHQPSEQTLLFLRDKQAWENAIAAYNGPDPLELWYNYICWYDYNIHIDPENKFRESLEKCLTLFEHNDMYKQDVRVIKLWAKYIDSQTNPLNFYQILYQRGIGTTCSCFYIGWAHYYDSANAFKQAESVYNLGFQAKAEPYSDLQEAHTKFRLSLSQRMLYDDNGSKKRSASHLIEQRQQITNLSLPLKTPKLETAGNLEQQNQSAPDAVDGLQEHKPILQHPPSQNSYLAEQQSNSNHHHHQVMTSVDEMNHVNHSQAPATTTTAQQQQQDAATVPGNTEQYVRTASGSQSDHCANVISSSLNYIYDESLQEEPIIEYVLENAKLPPNFPRYTKNNHEIWRPALCLEEPYDPYRCCLYQKHLVYPGNGQEASPEEIRARKWSRRLQEIQQERSLELHTQKQQELLIQQRLQQQQEELEQQQQQQLQLQLQQQQMQQQKQLQETTQRQQHEVQKTSPAPPTAQKQEQKPTKNSTGDDFDDIEEQIEASTIRFSTDTNGATRSKTITIKFRKKPAASTGYEQSFSSYMATPTKGSLKQLTDPYPRHSSSSKSKKVRKLKIVNNYDDPKYSQASFSRNQYDDANLLLSLSNLHSNGGSSNSNYTNGNTSTSTAVSETTIIEDSNSNSEFNASLNENSYLSNSTCSTPLRKLSQTYSSSKTTTPQFFRSLKKHTSSQSLQNDDSMCSYEQNSFFATEHNDDLKQRRLERALQTIETHLAKPAIDPFNTELCKAFLTKIGFPSRETNDAYKLVNTPLPKLANTRTTTLDNMTFNIEKEVGRGSYGSVYRAVNVQSGAVVALKYQKPPNTWEVYICTEVRRRINNYDILPGFMDISSAVIAPNASILVTEFSPYGSLLDINNKLRQATTKVMHESLVMHFSSQILNIVNHLHSCQIIHADIKPDNFLLMKVPTSDSHLPSVRLIDFGCAIDMTLFPDDIQFKKVIQTDGFTCTEMQEGKPWSYQTDLFCVAGTVHVMLFGEYMQLQKKFNTWDIKTKLPRYLKKHVWTEFFPKMLNIKDLNHLPNLIDMKSLMDDEIVKMDSELQSQIRTLSNILHRR